MHTCHRCRRILSDSQRDALCLKCLYSIERGRSFDDEPETKPGKRPLALLSMDMSDAGAATMPGR